METLVKPEELDIGDKFRLTGEACDPAEREDKDTYEVINKDLGCTLGAHLIVRGSDGASHETRIMPWVKVYKVSANTG